MDKNTIKPIPAKKHEAVVETYAEDMAQVLENDKEGLVKKIIHSEEEHEAEKRNLSPQSKKNKLFMVLSFSLLFFALIIFSIFFFKEDINTVPVEKQFVPIIFNEKSTFLEISGFSKDEILQSVFNQVNSTQVKDGGIEGVYLAKNKKIVGLREFISLINGNFVAGDNYILVQDDFLMGAVKVKTDSIVESPQSFFMLLKVHSISGVFSSMRAWEEKMLFNLHVFLGINISSATNYLYTKNFEDGIVENKNARILYDKDRKIILLYVFADDNSVIVTDSQNAVHEILLRLASSAKKQ